MIIGIPKETKIHEYRVGATPEMVKLFTMNGHQVLVQSNAGANVGFLDEHYRTAGAKIVFSPQEVFKAELILKVKELQDDEFAYIFPGQIIFSYLHLAPDLNQTKQLIEKKVIAIAYETVTDEKNRLPLLIPMSEIAGRIAIQAGATALQMNQGGKGLLLGGVPGVAPAKVTIIGGGVVGTEAARMALGLGSQVYILDNNLNRLRELDILFNSRLHTIYSSPSAIETMVKESDLVIGAVLVPGKTAPRLVTRSMIKQMSPGSVVVDVAIDQGGCFETSKPTNHDNPTYVVDGIVHYCVTNMPGACARTATVALTHATTPYALSIANKGYKIAMKENVGLMHGLNVCLGKITNEAVAHDLGFEYTAPATMICDSLSCE